MASVCVCGPAPGAPSFRPGVVRAAFASPADPAPVLPASSRLRNPADFRDTLRKGVRCGRASVVVHVRRTDQTPSRAGFIVSKAVGNAVNRNRVKRRLRHLAAAALPTAPFGVDLVVRALPAATAGDLIGDFDSALGTCLVRLSA
jgi:ribonuclease P protein component